MPERVLPENLSGEEARIALLDILGRRLERDGFLSPMTSYDWFEAEITVKMRVHDVGRTETVNVTEKATLVDSMPEGGEIEEVEGTIVIEKTDPNTIRQETGQEIPVLTTENGKPTIKKVRYPRKK